MPSLLLVWNPKIYPFDELTKWVYLTSQGKTARGQWSIGKVRPEPETRVWLFAKGEHPGIMGAGWTVGEPFEGPHFSKPSRTCNYIKITWEAVLDPGRERLVTPEVLWEDVWEIDWMNAISGMTLVDPTAAILEELWAINLEKTPVSPRRTGTLGKLDIEPHLVILHSARRCELTPPPKGSGPASPKRKSYRFPKVSL